MDEYRIVDCDFHDQLEELATLHQTCQIVYKTEAGNQLKVDDQIVDVYSEHHAEFLKLKSGPTIRLDHLVSVNDQPIAYAKNQQAD